MKMISIYIYIYERNQITKQTQGQKENLALSVRKKVRF